MPTHHTTRTARVLAAGLAAAAVCAPAANAMPLIDPPTHHAPARPAAPQPVAVARPPADGGFDWSAAGVGAAAGAAIAFAGAGAFASTRGRIRPARSS